VIEGSGLIVALLNAEEGFPYTQDMCRCRLLPKHPKELLIEPGRALKVWNLHGDMVHIDSREARRRGWSCERARGCQRACCCAARRAPPRPNAHVRIDVKMTEVVFIDFSCLVFHLLQCSLLEGQPDRRVVGILEIGTLDHHD
jgi:hypothetical protein